MRATTTSAVPLRIANLQATADPSRPNHVPIARFPLSGEQPYADGWGYDPATRLPIADPVRTAVWRAERRAERLASETREYGDALALRAALRRAGLAADHADVAAAQARADAADARFREEVGDGSR